MSRRTRAFYEKVATHPTFSIRLSAAEHLAGSLLLGRLLLDRASAVRDEARDVLEAHPQPLAEPLLKEIEAKFPSVFASLPPECINAKAKKRDKLGRREPGPSDESAPARLVYEDAVCPLTKRDLIAMAEDWEPAKIKHAGSKRTAARLFDALGDDVWQSVEFRRSLAARSDMTRKLALRLLKDADESVFARLIKNIDFWKRLTFEEKLALIKDDPKLIELFFMCSRSEKEIRSTAALFKDDQDPEIRVLTRAKLKNPKRVKRSALWSL